MLYHHVHSSFIVEISANLLPEFGNWILGRRAVQCDQENASGVKVVGGQGGIVQVGVRQDVSRLSALLQFESVR